MRDKAFAEHEEDSGAEDHLKIRHLYRLLLLPGNLQAGKKGGEDKKPKGSSSEETVEKENVMQYQLSTDNTVNLEVLLRLIVMHSEANLSNVVSSIDEFKQLFSISSQSVSEFLKQSFIQNDGTRDLFTMKWDTRQRQKVFGSNTSMLNRTQVETILDPKDEETSAR